MLPVSEPRRLKIASSPRTSGSTLPPRTSSRLERSSRMRRARKGTVSMKPAPPAGLHPLALELARHVLGRFAVLFRSGVASFERIGGEEANVAPPVLAFRLDVVGPQVQGGACG